MSPIQTSSKALYGPMLSMTFALLLPIPTAATALPPYSIPRDKSRLFSCEQLALSAQPGHVKHIQIRNNDEGFYYRFEIISPEGSLWAVVCDDEIQKIINRQLLD